MLLSTTARALHVDRHPTQSAAYKALRITHAHEAQARCNRICVCSLLVHSHILYTMPS